MTAVVPHYAMSGGTMISLGADRIVMDDHAALGPIDPQLGQYPAASILLLLRMFVEELVRGGDWQVTDRIVEVDSVDRVLLRRAASDEEIAESLRGATGLLLNPAIEEEGRVGPYEPRPLRDLVQPEGGELRLGSARRRSRCCWEPPSLAPSAPDSHIKRRRSLLRSADGARPSGARRAEVCIRPRAGRTLGLERVAGAAGRADCYRAHRRARRRDR